MNTPTSYSRSPKVFIIVLNWNNAPDTIECLESVFKLKGHDYQVVICDNDSADNSKAKIWDWLVRHNHVVNKIMESDLDQIKSPLDAEVVLISNEQNYGYAGGNNRGLRYALAAGADQDFVWIINNDTTFDPEALNKLLEEAAKRPEVGFFGSTILDFSNHNKIQTQGGDRFYPWFGMSRHIGEGRNLEDQLPQAIVESRMGYVVGASAFVRLASVAKIGLMEEGYFLYFEEVDWATRARRLGIKLGYAPESLVYHKEGSTIGSSVFARRKSELADYYGIKNRLVMTRRLFPWALPTVYMAMLFTLFKRLFTGQFDRTWMVLTIMLGIDQRPKQPS
ncbi:MAG: glycosyltransferase family 2 protein [Patescibacteria group bacterium]